MTTEQPQSKRAIVTGAASGIGRATALRLAKDFTQLVLIDIDEAGLAATQAAVEDLGVDSLTYVVDISDEDQVETMASEVGRHGAVHLVANIAGIGVRANVADTTKADWDRVIGINLTGTFLMCKYLVPNIEPSGVIINVASVGGIVGLSQRAAYCASKAGVVGLTKCIAVDYGTTGPRAVAVCPGTVETEWIEKILEDAPDRDAARAAMANRQLDGRLGTPQEIAAAIAFVASPDGRFINGSTFIIDGGLTAA